jgi:NAD(P)-dependent dehydrogenase (short-subunit alcohol dehydrogenase family)
LTALGKFRLDGRTAIVTGASRGIGEAIARALAEAGAHVAVASRKGCDDVAASINANGGRAVATTAHLGDEASIDRLVAFALDRLGGRVDIIVNNAATNPVFGPIVNADAAAFQKIFDVNMKGPFLLCQKLQPQMVEHGGGSLIHISSVGGITPEPMLGLYSSSKAALISLSKTMAMEWGGAGIRSNVICPGLVKTKFSQAIWQDEAMAKLALDQQPLPRAGEPDEIASMALFLASPASSYCTGAVFAVDGGHTI